MEAPQSNDDAATILIISFRGNKVEISLNANITTIGNVKAILLSSIDDDSIHMKPSDIKILYKGKVLAASENEGGYDDDTNMRELIFLAGSKKKARTATNDNSSKATTALPKTIRLIATGVSSTEVERNDSDIKEGIKIASRQVRDDITDAGKINEARRKRLGRAMLRKAAACSKDGGGTSSYGFGKIETLPNLPNQEKAKQILETLANDPGILACMAKHQWNVGCLAELYPEGKVGETDVCVMGLNQNKGQKILLRIRTDDLKGFRKMLSIRKVLFHELAHNVHSDHNGEFFQLMRQVERECNEMDWTQSQGSSVGGGGGRHVGGGDLDDEKLYEGGTYRLGGGGAGGEGARNHVPVRELAARAAMMRLTAEEEEIQRHCGCGHANSGGRVNATQDGNGDEQGNQS